MQSFGTVETDIEKPARSQPEKNLTTANCCICGGSEATLVGQGKDFEYDTSPDTFFMVRCNSCGLIYLNPRPAISEFLNIYPSTYHSYNFSKENFGIAYRVRTWLEKRRLMYHCNGLPDNAHILDIGCGDGFHLNLLRRFGKNTWSLEGVDLDKRAVDRAVKQGLKVHWATIETAGLAHESYDLIFMIMTIEHVEKPDDVLRAAYSLLKKNGSLVIVTDNTDSIDFKIFKSGHWGGYHFPRHWNLFNRGSLSKLSEKAGFKVCRLKTLVSPVNWVYSIHNILVDKKRPKWLVNRFSLKSVASLGFFTIIDFVLQKFGKGSILQATLEKV